MLAVPRIGCMRSKHLRVISQWCGRAVLFGLAYMGAMSTAPVLAADDAPSPELHTNQSYIEQLKAKGQFDIADMKAVFGFVFRSLPDRVKVYPTENYYYFIFYHQGVPYAGNIRLENETRDQGQLHFAYDIESNLWSERHKGEGFHILLDSAQGVTIEKLDKLIYRVAYDGKSVIFELNDLSGVKPPAGLLTADERYIGPVFDESGMRFFLVYNSRLKLFHYLLDETVPVADSFFPLKVSGRLILGRRTGFAFYRDAKRDRKILVGVFDGNVRINNYFDGPFDQLPDNFIEGESLRSAILEVDPNLKGKIDRFGSAPGGETRYLIAPYLQYFDEDDLSVIHQCVMNKRVPAEQYYACFAFYEGATVPIAMQRLGKERRQPKQPRR
jgi:hypothetical protein